MDFQERDTPSLAESTQSSKPSSTQQASELWEVVEEPRGRLGAEDIMPERQEGHLLKKRKWPLKGWHKRYFVLEDGVLHYATTRQDITKGKVHGSIDVRLSVMSINKKAQRIDLDTEDNIYHLKIKSQDLFQSWVSQLRAHRLAQRSDLPNATHRKAPGTQTLTAGSASALPGVGPREKVSSWLRDSDGLDRCSHALSECQGKLQELHRLLQSLESLHRIPSAPVIPTHQASVTTERPKKGKRTSRMWCTQGFAKDDTIGRVRWGAEPQVAGTQCSEGGAPSPFVFTVRLAVCMALFPTCLVTWNLGTLLAHVACHLRTMPIYSAVSGLWPRRCTTPSAVSWLPSPQNGTD